MKIILEGLYIKSEAEFHNIISRRLEFPDYYGQNLDALWDCLTSWIEPPVEIIWKDFENSKIFLGDFAIKVKNLFQDAEKEIEGFRVEFC